MRSRRHPRATGAPIPPGARYEIVDVLRGFALLGVFVANAIWMSRWFALTAEQRAALPTAELDAFVSLLGLMLVEYKFYTLFSILFGMGFAMQLGRAHRTESEVIRTYVRRLLVLLVIGVAHGLLLWFGDILHIYALLGLVLMAFRDRSDRELLGLVGGLALLVALLPLIEWLLLGSAVDGVEADESVAQARYAVLTQGSWFDIVRLNREVVLGDYGKLAMGFDSTVYWYLGVLWKFLLGFVIGRRMLLQQADEHLYLYRRALPPLLAVGLAGAISLGVATRQLQAWIPDYPSVWARLAWIPIDLSMLALSLAYVAGLVLLFHDPRFRNGLRLLAPVGRMALTNYLSQSVALVLLLYGVGLGLLGKVGVAAFVGLCLPIYGLQVALSGWWLKRFRFGPAEWLWRSLTYGKLQPMG